MSFVESAIDYGVAKGAEVAKRAAWSFAKTQTLASVLGIGTTVSSLTMMAAEHASDIARVSRNIVNLVRRLP